MSRNYMDICNEVAENLRIYLPNCEIITQSVYKNNDTERFGINIRTKDSNVAPVIYLNSVIDANYSIEELVRWVLDLYQRSNAPEVTGIIDDLRDFERIKDKIELLLVNKELNQETLNDLAYKDFLDLAIIAAVNVGFDENLNPMKVKVTKNLLKTWKVNFESVYSAGFEALCRTKAKIYDIFDLMGSLGDFESDYDLGKMYVLSNIEGYFGANLVLRTDILADFARKIGSNLALIPSSVHEWLLVPTDILDQFRGDFRADLDSMIAAVNGSEVVGDEEILGTHTYYFDREKEEILCQI